MLDTFNALNMIDDNGYPAGGYATGTGLDIHWQEGPLDGRGDDRASPNGAFVETVIAVAKQRIEFYQTVTNGKFACDENARAIAHLEHALAALNERTQKREARGVEGTHEA